MTIAEDRQSRMRARILSGPVLPAMLSLGLPTMVLILAQISISIIETFWISRLGTAALASVTLVFPILGLIATMSNGGIGGGVSSAVARALGAGRHADASVIVWHALFLALVFGAITAAVLLVFGRAVYTALGGEGDVLTGALTYSGWVFAGAVPLWILNLLSAAMRGAGEVRFPAMVSLLAAVALVPLSPVLIFGIGPVPAFGIAGAGMAVLVYYLVTSGILLMHLAARQDLLALRPAALSRQRFSEILGVGMISAAGTVVANLTTILVTGAVGISGAVYLAGFGIASRIDFLIIPLMFGFGTSVVTMIGVAAGAGDMRRVRQIGLIAGLVTFSVTQAVGLLAAVFPGAWLGIFTDAPDVIAAGSDYLRFAAPAYGFLGLGLTFYFAAQGLGKMAWPFAGGMVRLCITALGAWYLAAASGGVVGPAIAVAAGFAAFGLINVYGFHKATRTGR